MWWVANEYHDIRFWLHKLVFVPLLLSDCNPLTCLSILSWVVLLGRRMRNWVSTCLFFAVFVCCKAIFRGAATIISGNKWANRFGQLRSLSDCLRRCILWQLESPSTQADRYVTSWCRISVCTPPPSSAVPQMWCYNKDTTPSTRNGNAINFTTRPQPAEGVQLDDSSTIITAICPIDWELSFCSIHYFMPYTKLFFPFFSSLVNCSLHNISTNLPALLFLSSTARFLRSSPLLLPLGILQTLSLCVSILFCFQHCLRTRQLP